MDEIGEENVSFFSSTSQNATKREEDQHEVLKVWISECKLLKQR